MFCHTAGLWQFNSPLLPILGPSLQTPYRSFLSKSSIYTLSALSSLSFNFSFITSFISLSPLIICDIQFFFLQVIVSTMILFSPTLLRTSSFVILSVQLMRSILLYIHIFFLYLPSEASRSYIESYRPDQITVFTTFFFTLLLIPLVNNSFLLLKASFAIPILVLIAVSLLPSSVIQAPKYLNLLTCSTFCPSIFILIQL